MIGPGPMTRVQTLPVRVKVREQALPVRVREQALPVRVREQALQVPVPQALQLATDDRARAGRAAERADTRR